MKDHILSRAFTRRDGGIAPMKAAESLDLGGDNWDVENLGKKGLRKREGGERRGGII